MDGSGFCEAPHLAAAQCAGGEGDGGQRDAAAGGDTAAGHLPWRTAARGARGEGDGSVGRRGWPLAGGCARHGAGCASRARVRHAYRAQRAAASHAVLRAVPDAQSAARRARAYAVSRVPPRWCSVWRAPKPRAHSPQAALSRAPRRDLQAACGRKARAVRHASPAGARRRRPSWPQRHRKAAGRAADAPHALDDLADPGVHAGAAHPIPGVQAHAAPRRDCVSRREGAAESKLTDKCLSALGHCAGPARRGGC